MKDEKEFKPERFLSTQSLTISKQSRWLRKSRQALGLDVKSLAQELGVSTRTINAWENENNSNLPSREKLFHYMFLLFGKRSLPDPTRLLHLGLELGIAGERTSTQSLFEKFFRLNKRQKLLVGVMIRTLYQTQRRETVERTNKKVKDFNSGLLQGYYEK